MKTARILLLALSFLNTVLAYAHSKQHHKHEHSVGEQHNEVFGEAKAIRKASKDGMAFQLSREARRRLAIKSSRLAPDKSSKESILTVPFSSLLFSLDDTAIYVYVDGWYQYLPATLISRHNLLAVIKVADLPQDSELVTHGVPLLRVAHLQAMGKVARAHVH